MKIIARTSTIIGEKIRMKEEILTVTASRRFEQNVMRAVPIAMVGYLELTSPGFFDVLYTTIAGRILMTGCLLLYLGSVILAKKMLERSV